MLKQLVRTLSLTALVVLPLHVMAAPVSITTTTSGDHSISNDYILDMLGIDRSNLGEVPFEMTLQSNFDTDITPAVQTSGGLSIAGADITVTLHIGTGTFQRQGKGWTTLVSGPAAYGQTVGLYGFGGTDSIDFSHILKVTQDAAVSDPLTPRNLSASGDNVGTMLVTLNELDPEWPQTWYMGGTVTSGAVAVSAVPEPSQWAMMAAGLLAGTAVARRRKQA